MVLYRSEFFDIVFPIFLIGMFIVNLKYWYKLYKKIPRDQDFLLGLNFMLLMIAAVLLFIIYAFLMIFFL